LLIKGFDLGLSKYLIGDVNPFKKKINILKNDVENQKLFYSFPSIKSTFRKYRFPFKDKAKIDKAIKTQLMIDLPLPIDAVNYSYFVKIDKNGADVFCVVARKEDLEMLRDGDIVDSEIFSLLRLCVFLGYRDCNILHFSKGYILEVLIKDSFIKQVRVMKDVKNIPEDYLLSGSIPDSFLSYKKLKIAGINTEYNVSYGLLLRGIYDIGIDLLNKSRKSYLESILKSALYLLLSSIIVNGAVFYKVVVLESRLERIKEKEKRIFIKGFDYSGEVFDPLEQAKSKMLTVKKRNMTKTDVVDILDFIGKSIKDTGIMDIYYINISKKRFRIKGSAGSISDVEIFKNKISKKYVSKVEETVATPDGKIRFVISGEYGE